MDNHRSSWKTPSKRHTTPNHTNSGTHPSTSTSPRFPYAFRARARTPTGDHPCKWTLFSNTFRHHVRHATMQPRKKVGPLNKCAACLTLSANEKEETSQNRPSPGSMFSKNQHNTLNVRKFVLRSPCFGKRNVYKTNTRTVRGSFLRPKCKKNLTVSWVAGALDTFISSFAGPRDSVRKNRTAIETRQAAHVRSRNHASVGDTFPLSPSLPEGFQSQD